MPVVTLNETINGALEGQIAQASEVEMRVVRLNDAVIAPGRVVTRDGNDRKVKVPTSVGEVQEAVGCVELRDMMILSSNNSGSYPIGSRLSVVRKGVISMTAVTAATQGKPVFVYYGTGDTTLRGKVSGTFDDGENALLPGARFATSQATPGSQVAVEFDLPGDIGPTEGFGAGKGYVDVVVDLASIPANTAPDQSTLVTGALAGDVFAVTDLTASTVGLVIGAGRCRVDGTVVWRVGNVTVSAIDNASNTFRFSLVSRQ